MARRGVLLALVSLGLAGCDSFWRVSGVGLAVNTATLVAFQRTVPDVLYSILAHKDCSATRIEKGLSYCVPDDPPMTETEFCTRSIGAVDCWAHPALLPGETSPLADAPAPTHDQIAGSSHHWPAF